MLKCHTAAGRRPFLSQGTPGATDTDRLQTPFCISPHNPLSDQIQVMDIASPLTSLLASSLAQSVDLFLLGPGHKSDVLFKDWLTDVCSGVDLLK